ncbi:TerD family protein [Rhodococcus tibetensis]|uniref:TerD family protein n=1 Tax=Rhodococcus tibetensis TaxID=2965064 RepID=A0ABT1QFY0_9NOCA|nr:TerD family protein [Rhodococcus sp. FXJ9.536]MCQ4121199.1 TerD family protein [Rhodococcus sp. FXJ9.536]
MTVHLAAGQNIVLPSRSLSFQAMNVSPVDVSVLVVDGDLRALSSEHFVFYNARSAAGVTLDDGNAVRLSLDEVDRAAAAVLCVVSVDPTTDAATTLPRSGVSATLADEHGTSLVAFEVPLVGSETAAICLELYRRGDEWKVRAVGQGYDGGLAELLTRHGVEVDEPVSTDPAPTRSGPAAVPLDPAHSFERVWMIFEDAARSAASFRATRDYAQARLDDELSASVADPSTRNSHAVVELQARAQERCDALLGEAQSKFAGETTLLAEELRVIDPLLPRSLATFESTSWSARHASGVVTDGLRLGELSAPDLGDLRVPFCVHYPLSRPLWILGDPAEAAPVVAALAVRMLVASSAATSTLEVVDLSGSLRAITEPLAALLSAPVVNAASDIAARLTALSESVDLAEMAARSGIHDKVPSPRLVILNDFPHGYGAEDAARIVHLADHGPAAGTSLIIVGDNSAAQTDPGVAVLERIAQQVPSSGVLTVSDPWTRNQWILTPDRLPADPLQRASVLDSLTGR